jgi:hypothetical protein
MLFMQSFFYANRFYFPPHFTNTKSINPYLSSIGFKKTPITVLYLKKTQNETSKSRTC